MDIELQLVALSIHTCMLTVSLLQYGHDDVIVPVVQFQPGVQGLGVVFAVHEPVVANAEVVLKSVGIILNRIRLTRIK